VLRNAQKLAAIGDALEKGSSSIIGSALRRQGD
jgi:hypothetical protein